ncbi:MAG: hypothetical protein WAM95_18850, partial [Bacillus sp. (in: firmicutes)]
SVCSKCVPIKSDHLVAAFPPSALPNFIGTTLLSDSLQRHLVSSLIIACTPYSSIRRKDR